MNFLVLSSSRGTTFQAVLDAMHDRSLTMQCLGLITDRADRGCIGKARSAGLPVEIVEAKPGGAKDAYDERVMQTMTRLGASQNQTVIAALGWMHILTPGFIHTWKNRIVNVHPSLLPQYGGTGMFGDKVHDAVIRNGDQETGITIHLIDEGIDTGPILLQKTCPVLPDDTVETLKARVQGLEREWYPRVLEMIEQKEIFIDLHT